MKTRSLLASLTLILTTGVAAVAGNNDFCQATSQDARNSCRVAARSAFLLATGKCENVADPAGRQSCQPASTSGLSYPHCSFVTPNSPFGRPDVSEWARNLSTPSSIQPTSRTKLTTLFPLTPGTVFVYEGQTAGVLCHTEFFVTHNTVQILGVTTAQFVPDAFLADVLRIGRCNCPNTLSKIEWPIQHPDRDFRADSISSGRKSSVSASGYLRRNTSGSTENTITASCGLPIRISVLTIGQPVRIGTCSTKC